MIAGFVYYLAQTGKDTPSDQDLSRGQAHAAEGADFGLSGLQEASEEV
jgi:hypothetical protein